MSQQSDIEWTDATWNPVRGCVKVSPGCAHCYAETFAERFRGVPGHPYEQGFDLRLVPEKLAEPLSWKKPRRVFVNSMSDLFQDGVPFDYVKRVWDVMAEAQRHTFQVLTKRPERMLAFTRWLAGGDDISAAEWPRNVWLGVSVENQHFANERIPLLLQTPAAIRFISAEPLLEEVNLRDLNVGDGLLDALAPWDGGDPDLTDAYGGAYLNWVIIGGESGPKARGLNVNWVRSIVRQCKAARVPVFVKQLGARIIDRNDAGFMGEWPEAWPDHIDIEDRVEHDLDGTRDGYQGAPVRVHLRNRKGNDPSEWPPDLQIRQFP